MQKVTISARVDPNLKLRFETMLKQSSKSPGKVFELLLSSVIENPHWFGIDGVLSEDSKFALIFGFYTQSKDHLELAKSYLPKEVSEKWEEFISVFKNHITEEITDKWLEKNQHPKG